MLGISKGCVGMGTSQLATLGSIRKAWIPGDRRDIYLRKERRFRVVNSQERQQSHQEKN